MELARWLVDLRKTINFRVHQRISNQTRQPPDRKPINLQIHQLTNSRTYQLTNSSTQKITNSKLKKIVFILQSCANFHSVLAKNQVIKWVKSHSF